MTPRIEASSFPEHFTFDQVVSFVIEAGYSRIPVYQESADNVIGILYIKDLLPHLKNNGDFDWKTLLRKPFFVPENKKLDDLLKEFQEKKNHLAIVVDEYGGTCGIITLEDWEDIKNHIQYDFIADNYFNELKSNNLISPTNYLKGYASTVWTAVSASSQKFPVLSSLTTDQVAVVDEQLSCTSSDHQFFSDYNKAAIKFLSNPCQ